MSTKTIEISNIFHRFTRDINSYENLSDKTSIYKQNLSDWGPRRDPLYIVIPFTFLFGTIFLTGLIGNISTCIVIARNKSMHTATNYYLFSLAISDLLLLISGLPQEMYYIWSKYPYVFGEAFCVLQGFAAETSANATVLTITAFTVERYIAICHPFLSHTMSKLSRAIKFILIIWVVAICLAVPQAMSFGIVYERLSDGISVNEDHNTCNVKRIVIPHSFLISTVLCFMTPMTLITILYILIGLQLRQSSVGPVRGGSIKLNHLVYKKSLITHTNSTTHPSDLVNENGGVDFQISPQEETKVNNMTPTSQASTQHVVKMLVAVVVAFFICWAPFHAQRLLAIYGQSTSSDMVATFSALTYISGVLYYLSTTINPVLYHIMSHKFRLAFKETLLRCLRQKQHPKVLLRYSTSPGRPSIDKGSESDRALLYKLTTRNENLSRHFKHNRKVHRSKNSTVYLNSPLVNGSQTIKYMPCVSSRKMFVANREVPESRIDILRDPSVVYANYNAKSLSDNNWNNAKCQVSVCSLLPGQGVYKRCNSCNLSVIRRDSINNTELSKSVTMPNVKVCYIKSSVVP